VTGITSAGGVRSAGFLNCMAGRKVSTLQRLEVASAGEVYFSPAGHVLIYPGPAKVLEFESSVRAAAVHGRYAASCK
jgi:hypothetical protein